MGCRRVAAMHLVPLISRLVLAAAFIPAGWGKVMGTSTVEGPEAAAIRTMLADPWKTTPTDASPPAEPSAADSGGDSGETTVNDGRPAADTEAGAESTSTDPADATPEPEAAPASEAPLEIRNVLGLATMLEAHGLPMPVVLAWIAALVELVGGGLLVIGLLSRVWALGLLVAMGVAFALTSLDPVLASGPFGLDIPTYTKAVAQLALGALALGVLVSGPGAVAIDHSIFGSSRSRDPFDDDDDHD